MAYPRLQLLDQGYFMKKPGKRGGIVFETILFDNWNKLFRIFMMALLVYPFLIILLRTSGKRSLTKVNIFDFIITVAYGASFASILLTNTVTFADGALLLFMLTALQFILSKLEVHFDFFAKLVKSKPVFLYVDGQIKEAAVKKNRLKEQDLKGAIRKEGLFSYNQVEAIVLEGDGTLAVIHKDGSSYSKEALEGVEGR